MASPSELSLDCKPQSYSMLLKSFAEQQYPDQTKNLEEFLSCLEDERLKIDAFKRELPLCMQLLTNAVESSRQQLQTYRGHNSNINNNTATRPILEEFIPLKTSISEGSEKPTNTSDKANWMTSAQLWSQNSTTTDHATKLQPTTTLNKMTCQTHKDHQTHDHISFNVISPSSNNTNNKLALDTKLQRNNGGAFLPFSKADRITTTRAAPVLPELALAASAEKEGELLEDKKSCLEGNIENIIKREKVGNSVVEQGKGGVNLHEEQTNNVVSTNNNITNNNNNNNTNGSTTGSNNNNNNNNNNNQTHRKARRCWSPELHRRFVSALQMLGGSQVATPKQIRELMKVDGLTNDEVKSHLQKYRLHTRRPSPSPQATGGGPAPQLVVLGGIWVPPEYAAAHGGGPAGLYPAPHSGQHYCGPPVPQDFYAAAPAPAPAMAHQMHHHHAAIHHHHQFQMYKAASHMVHGSPESDIRGGTGDRSESIEDGKSESSSWKGESGGENGGGERKGLAALREDGEESNGSEITLKF